MNRYREGAHLCRRSSNAFFKQHFCFVKMNSRRFSNNPSRSSLVITLDWRLITGIPSISEHRQYHCPCTKYLQPQTSSPLSTPLRPSPENIRNSQLRRRQPYCYRPSSSPCVNRPPTLTHTHHAPPGNSNSPREYVKYSATRPTEIWRPKFRVKYIQVSLTMHIQKCGQCAY